MLRKRRTGNCSARARDLPILALAMSVATILSGCGGGDDSGAVETPVAQQTVTVTATPSPTFASPSEAPTSSATPSETASEESTPSEESIPTQESTPAAPTAA